MRATSHHSLASTTLWTQHHTCGQNVPQTPPCSSADLGCSYAGSACSSALQSKGQDAPQLGCTTLLWGRGLRLMLLLFCLRSCDEAPHQRTAPASESGAESESGPPSAPSSPLDATSCGGTHSGGLGALGVAPCGESDAGIAPCGASDEGVALFDTWRLSTRLRWFALPLPARLRHQLSNCNNYSPNLLRRTHYGSSS